MGDVSNEHAPTGTVRRDLSWFFRDRHTGKIAIIQLPNIPLMVWLAATVAGRLLHNNVLMIIASIALVIWAVDEIARGVNPFRRCLGAAVLVAILIHAVMSL